MTGDAEDHTVMRVQATYQHGPVGFGVLTSRGARGLAGTNVYVAAGYTYTGMKYLQQPRTRVEIDLNVRVRGNDTFVSFDDLSGPVAVNEAVEVYESESGLAGEGRVTEIDADRELVYLSVDWPSLKEDGSSSNEEPWTFGPGEGWTVDEPWTVSGEENWTFTTRESSAVTTELVFVGGVVSTAALQEPWMELIARPCLAGIGSANGSIWMTAPLYNSTDFLLNTFAEPFMNPWQTNLNLGSMTGVAA